MDIETEFNKCVEKVGGLKVSSLVGESPPFYDADYLFPQYEIISELKCLDQDKVVDENIVKKSTEIYERYLSENKVPNLGKGRVRLVTSNEFPEELKRELIELFRKPIQSVIKKANKQIRLTKENLNIEKHDGLLILVNNGHSILTPEVLVFIIKEMFERNSFSSIDVVLYFTTKPKSEHADIPEDFLVWIPLQIRPEKKWPSELIYRLGKAWFNRIADITGEPVRTYSANSEFDISDISNKEPSKKRFD